MTIKPDHWIRKMSLEHGMIQPFESSQVRDGVISYGVSSYGYDIRVADEFKIFTNVYSAIVDPKHFDTKSMVDYRGDVCIIPPNSFALARTVEYFRIPRTVLTVCVGKSTYARCFRGDTRVALVDGSALSLEEMARRADDGESFWGYSLVSPGRMIASQLQAPRFIGRDSLVEIGLANQGSIQCTPDHEFITRDGRLVPAHDLRPGDRLWAFQPPQAPAAETISPLPQVQPASSSQSGWSGADGLHPLRGAQQRSAGSGRSGWPTGLMERWAGTLAEGAGPGTAVRASGGISAGPGSALPFRPAAKSRKIESIRTRKGDHDVYCLTVPQAGNFALEAGVFVRNCGIIVNVTPFEPEWEGFVTLEISNTTPLPAKIYANEGIAQVLFFEADEECEISYADKKGKYQRQQSIVLPKL